MWFARGDADLLRRAAPDTTAPLDLASFPLVPYANRIAHGRFRFEGVDYQVPLNFGDHTHSIHGVGWTTPWAIEAQAEDRLVLVHRHEADDQWPWSYAARQEAVLDEDGLRITLTVHNLDAQAMPAGLGFHPYFVKDGATRLGFGAEGLWLSTPDMLPEREVEADALGDWSKPASVDGDSLIDNAYVGWSGTATISRGDGVKLVLTGQDAPYLHFYRPPGEQFFCLEPVSHLPDAVNRPAGMEALAPGAKRSLAMAIAVKVDEALPNAAEIA